MRKPWWRKFNQTWYIELPSGKQHPLGKDPHGEGRKTPPKEIQKAWHALGLAEPVADMPFEQAVILYLKHLEGAPSYVIAKQHLEDFSKHVGNITVGKLRQFHWTQYSDGKEWAPSYALTKLGKIQNCLNYCVEQGYIKSHEFKVSKHALPKIQKREQTITSAEQDQIEAKAYPALRTMLQALRESGCRPKELCLAKIEQTDLEEKVMLVANKTAKRTGEKHRIIYMSEKMAEIVRESIGDRKAGFVFLNSFGNPWKRAQIGHSVRKIRIKLGMEKGKTPYQYRHKFASDAINEADVNPVLVARLLGHKDTRMILKTYFHDDKEALKRAVQKVSDAEK